MAPQSSAWRTHHEFRDKRDPTATHQLRALTGIRPYKPVDLRRKALALAHLSNIRSIIPRMERLGFPPGAFVSATMTRPFHGRIVQPERWKPGRVLWECDHEHQSIPEAFQCAGEEAGRNGIT